MKISSSVSSLGFTFSLFLFLQSLFPPLAVSSQRRLLQISSQLPQKNPQFFPSTAIPAFINTQLPPSPSLPPPVPNPTYSENDNLTTAIVSTAASSFALSFFVFFALYRFNAKKTRIKLGSATKTSGVDLLYWRSRCFNCLREDDDVRQRRQEVLDQKAQETPLLFSNSANSSSGLFARSMASPENSVTQLIPPAEKPPAESQSLPPPPTAALPKPPIPPHVIKSPAPPLPPPLPPAAAPKPPIPLLLKKSQAPPPPPPRHRPNEAKDRPRLKPLHWEKMIPTGGGRSMVWDRLNDGSIKFNEDQMEALFAANLNPPKSFGHPAAAAIGTQTSLLDGRKSQNAAIVLRMVAVSRQEIIDGLRHGHGLAADTLEKLARIAPTKDEESLILSFTGDPAHLSHAESFLFSLLQAIPSAFPRISAMHFFSSVYEQETLHLKQCLATLELACKELRTRGLLLKLLEAVLKAGNRMNAGTAMGNARAFDLATLPKLSGVKSADGSTSLLHFVVGEVVRSEGKHCAGIAGRGVPLEEREREYLMLGLPVVGGLSAEFANVKAAAAMDFDSLAGTCTALADRVADVRQLLRGCGEGDEGFAREMADFTGAAERELEELKEDQWRVAEMVKRTTEYYQPGAAGREKEGKPQLQLFAIISGFLTTVDQACVDIARNVQKMKKKQAAVPLTKEKRVTAAARFMAENTAASRSESEKEF